MLPLKDASKYIQQDNDELSKILKEDFRELEDSIRKAQENVDTLKSSMDLSLKQAEQDYHHQKQQL